jgi:uncharacterized membrane protein SirB2
MSEFASWYLQIKAAHIGLVLASGALFAVRGALVLAGRGWAMAKPWRMTSYGIDTALLMAGVMLWAGLSLNPASSPWLGAKLTLLVLYIVLGSLALKRARSPTARAASYGAALAVYGFMVSVALAHQPLGFLHAWMTHGA